MNNEEVVDSFFNGYFNPKRPSSYYFFIIQKIVQDRNHFLSYTIYGTKKAKACYDVGNENKQGKNLHPPIGYK